MNVNVWLGRIAIINLVVFMYMLLTKLMNLPYTYWPHITISYQFTAALLVGIMLFTGKGWKKTWILYFLYISLSIASTALVLSWDSNSYFAETLRSLLLLIIAFVLIRSVFRLWAFAVILSVILKIIYFFLIRFSVDIGSTELRIILAYLINGLPTISLLFFALRKDRTVSLDVLYE